MATLAQPLPKTISLGDSEFIQNKFTYYQRLRDEAPIHRAKVLFLNPYVVSRYDDCLTLLKDPRFVRNTASIPNYGGWLSLPMPRMIRLFTENMIYSDGDAHRRLRNLVHKAFTPRAIAQLESRIEHLTHELLDQADPHTPFDIRRAYALPIPLTVISEMVGAEGETMEQFQSGMSALIQGFSDWRNTPTMMREVPRLVRVVRELVAYKRDHPGDDILTGLIQAEVDGEKLTDDELVAMVFLLISAGYETTVYLITNVVAVLLKHPDQLALLRDNPDLMASAVEEVLRYEAVAHMTEMIRPSEDVEFHGVTVPKGKIVLPLLGAANRDPAVFDDPDTFDITRDAKRHLGFGQGIHYCLGAPLARIETQIALKTLLERSPNLRLAIPTDALQFMEVPALHSYDQVPVLLD